MGPVLPAALGGLGFVAQVTTPPENHHRAIQFGSC